jgi:hypothetical protein
MLDESYLLENATEPFLEKAPRWIAHIERQLHEDQSLTDSEKEWLECQRSFARNLEFVKTIDEATSTENEGCYSNSNTQIVGPSETRVRILDAPPNSPPRVSAD